MAANIIQVIIAIILSVTLIFIAKTFRNASLQRLNSDIFAFLSRCSDEQDKYERDDLRRNAHSIFDGHGPIGALEVLAASEHEKELACLHYLGDRLNLIFQAWVISDQSDTFDGLLAGWKPITSRVMYNIRMHKERSNVLGEIRFPDYYCNACDRTLNYLEEGNFYPDKFISLLLSSGVVVEIRSLGEARQQNSLRHDIWSSCRSLSDRLWAKLSSWIKLRRK